MSKNNEVMGKKRTTGLSEFSNAAHFNSQQRNIDMKTKKGEREHDKNQIFKP